MNNMKVFKDVYGSMNRQADGRLSGHEMRIYGVRRDGKYTVTHFFGSGKRINKIYTVEQLTAEIEKFSINA
jgi:hypothetical protein